MPTPLLITPNLGNSNQNNPDGCNKLHIKIKNINSWFYPFNFLLIMNLTSSTCFKQVGTDAAKDWGSCGMLEKHLSEPSTGEQGYWWQVIVSWMITKGTSPKGSDWFFLFFLKLFHQPNIHRAPLAKHVILFSFMKTTGMTQVMIQSAFHSSDSSRRATNPNWDDDITCKWSILGVTAATFL